MSCYRSIMITRLKEIDPVVCDAIYKPVFLRDPPRPAAFKHISKRLRFAHALKRITHDCLNQIKDPDSNIPIRFHPVSEVFPKLLLKYGGACGVTGHRGSHVSEPGGSWAALFRFRRGAKQQASGERSAAIGADGLSR